MKFNLPINNFSAGEWSEAMKARTDTEQYVRACEELKNFIPQMTGGAQYRGGFQKRIAANQTDIDLCVGNSVRMIPYLPSNTAYQTILFTDPTNPWSVGPISGTLTVAANVNTAGWTGADIQYAQMGDILVLTHTGGTFRPLIFYYDSTAAAYKLELWGYVSTNVNKAIPWSQAYALGSGVTMTPSATTGAINVTASAAFFNASMVGADLRLCTAGSIEGVVRLTGFTSTTVMAGTVTKTLPSIAAFGATAAPTTFWQIRDWNDSYGWPRTVTNFQGRVIFGGSSSKPDTIWGSRISNVYDFTEIPSPETTGVYGFSGSAYISDNSRPFTLSPNLDVSTIKALSSSKTLVILTDQREIVAYGSNGALGPTNVVFESSTSYGAAGIQPVRINNFMTFVQKNGFKVRDVIFNFDESQYKSTDLSFIAEHFFRTEVGSDTITELARFESKSSVLYVKTSSGKVYGLTLDRDYQVNSWFRVYVGRDSDDADFLVRTICAIDSTLYILCERTINGVQRFTLEASSEPWEYENPYSSDWTGSASTGDGVDRPVYLDCARYAVTNGAAVGGQYNAWKCRSGVQENFYRGCTIDVVADGSYIGQITPDDDADGGFTLPNSLYATEVLIGYRYQGVIKTMPIEAGGQYGVPVGRIKRIHELVVRFLRSLGTTVGADEDHQEDLPFRPNETPSDEATPYYTGDMAIVFNGGYERQAQVVIVQDEPYPCHVVCVAPHGVTHD